LKSCHEGHQSSLYAASGLRAHRRACRGRLARRGRARGRRGPPRGAVRAAGMVGPGLEGAARGGIGRGPARMRSEFCCGGRAGLPGRRHRPVLQVASGVGGVAIRGRAGRPGAQGRPLGAAAWHTCASLTQSAGMEPRANGSGALQLRRPHRQKARGGCLTVELTVKYYTGCCSRVCLMTSAWAQQAGVAPLPASLHLRMQSCSQSCVGFVSPEFV